MDFIDNLEKAVTLITEAPDYREKLVKRSVRNISRAATEAIALDEEERRCIEAVDAFDERDMPEEAAAARTRVTLVHKARCEKIRVLAVQMALVMTKALGSLRVDETTVGTGLTESERRAIALITSAEVEL